ncbi:MAG: hypothetical protein ABIV25_04120 [Paracoccaceae bacterium]
MMLNLTMQSTQLRRIARVLAVIAIALAAGHLVQALAARKPVHLSQAIPPILPTTPVKVVQLSAGANDDSLVAPQIASVTPMPIAAACVTSLKLRQEPGAVIGMALAAPCHDGERVVLRHAGLAVTAKTAADGTLATEIPALSAEGKIEVLFSDGSTVEATIAMPETVLLRRFGVQWEGTEAFAVHGFQNGADYDQSGDISATNPGKVVAATGSFLSVLGDATVANPLLAQIYTYPMDATIAANVVVEAAVTEATCGHDLLGETLMSERGIAAVTDLTLAMPDCTGIGSFLVLKNLASDTKLAAN